MKVVITESRRDRLDKNELDKEFSNLYEDVNYDIRKQKVIQYLKDDEIIMIYGDRNKVLYICEDIVKPIVFFGYTPQEVKRLIGEWFSVEFKLQVDLVHHVNKSTLII